MSTAEMLRPRLSEPSPERPARPEGSRTGQMLRYARDMATLYARSVREGDGERLVDVERRFDELARISMAAAEAPSAEAVCGRVAVELAGLLGVQAVVVLFHRAGKMRVLAAHGTVAPRSTVPREAFPELGCPAVVDDPALRELVGGGPALVVPFPGRGDALVGAACLPEVELKRGSMALVELLGRFVGVALESYAVEEQRVAARRGGTRPISLDAAALGESQVMRSVTAFLGRVAPTSSPVLILGETGTGKELAATTLHARSGRKGPFVAVNCGAIPEHLVESELFGHEAGAFTGAQRRHRGKVEQATGGTLFLDEVGELPPASQVKLLRFLQDGRYTPVGAEAERAGDVRIVAATNRDLRAAVAAGTFREDLLFRLDILTVQLPPLRDRGEDVVLLARSFVTETTARCRRDPMTLSPEAEAALRSYPWPGNVRELKNVIERAVILSPAPVIGADLLPERQTHRAPAAASLVDLDEGDDDEPEGEGPPASGPRPVTPDDAVLLELPFCAAKAASLEAFERRYLEALLTRHRGNVARAARASHMDRKNLSRKLQDYGLRGFGRTSRGPR